MEAKDQFDDEKPSPDASEEARRFAEGRSMLKDALNDTMEDTSSADENNALLNNKTSTTTNASTMATLKTVLLCVVLFSLVFGFGIIVGHFGIPKKNETNQKKEDTTTTSAAEGNSYYVILSAEDEKSLMEAVEAEEQMRVEEQQAVIASLVAEEDQNWPDGLDEIPPDSGETLDPVNSLDAFYEMPNLLDEEPTMGTSLVYDDVRAQGGLNAACYDNLEDSGCSPFSSLLDQALPTEELVVPCGECYEVDITDQRQVLLQSGLRIEGKLYFPSTANITIRTKFVWVMGLLKMDTPEVGNRVKFSLYSDELHTLVTSQGACSFGGCSLGSKVIAVQGGQVDIRGIEDNCPAWEKLTAVGAGEEKPMDLPCNTWNTAVEGTECWTSDVIGLTGACVDQGHRVMCPIKDTSAAIGSGTSEPIKFTSIARGKEWKPPCNTWNTAKKGSDCWATNTITLTGPCVDEGRRVRCPIADTGAFIGSGSRDKMKFTSVDGPTGFEPPCNTWNTAKKGTACWETNVIKLRGACVDEGRRVRCPIEDTGAFVGSGSRDKIKFTSASGQSMTSSHIMHWSWAGKWLFLKPDQAISEINSIFSTGDQLTVELVDAPPTLGQSMTSSHIMHWSWAKKFLFLKPDQSVDEINSMFATGYKLRVDPASSPELGQIMTSSDIIHWSWKGKFLFLRPDQTIGDINNMFSSGYQLKVEKVIPDKETYEIQVSPEAASCWKEGTEILLTSHTRDQDDRQVGVIESADPQTGIIRFTGPIESPISLADHPDFAVEVASLSRRIVFEADDDADDEFIGGHFVIHHTPAAQHIEGVEIRNFGQQGRLGKYPIHFHMCGDSPGSKVKKNVVRESNQRCYVVHLTNSVTLEDNVAFDTFGHCYFIEDGAEIQNTFIRNLGTGIKIMPEARVAQLESQSGRTETDGSPFGFNGASVFWISNPQNHFIGNIAAGGQKNGYWFETRNDRSKMSLGTFKDNEVHSCRAMAFTTYNPGWRPDEVALIANLKAYRNPAAGAFLHVTRNLHFQGGLFADNANKDVFITRGDNLVFDGTVFIGQTEFASKNCRSNKVGIHLDPFRLHETILGSFSGQYRGTIVQNAIFQNYSLEATGCSEASAPMKFGDHQTFVEAYNAPHTMIDVKFDTPSSLDACMPGSGIDDVQVEIASDAHSAFTREQGFLLSPKFSSLVPTGCDPYNSCLKFCSGACLRTVTIVAGDASFSEDVVMIVEDSSTDNQITINRDIRGFPEPDPTSNKFSDAYTVVLPKGSFKIRFERMSSPGTQVWPGYAFPVLEAAPSSCDDYIVETDLAFLDPPASRSECNQLIHNGDFDSGNGWGIEGWNGFHGNVQHMPTSGIDGSGAIATNSSGNNAWPTQVIDSSCLEAGVEYEVQLSYKIVDDTYNEIHQGDVENLPKARVRSEAFDTSDPSNKHLSTTAWTDVATTSADSPTSGWRTMKGSWIISEVVAAADVHKFNIQGGPAQLLVDNVSVRRLAGRRHGLRG